MNTANSIVWLHLSDLHLCEQKTGWDCHRVLEPLLKDLKEMEGDHGLRPDLIFFTGDAAFGNLPQSSLAQQYGEVADFLDSVRQAFSVEVPKQNVFLVPGNHDVDRKKATRQLTAWLRDKTRTADEITTLIQAGDEDWKNYAARLCTYGEFLETHGYGHLLEDRERLIYAAIREVNGVKLGIAGLNSAWSCGEDQEQGKVWLGGDWQSGTVTRKLKQEAADIRVALTHHPLNWFVEQEGKSLRTRFMHSQDFHVLLHGHEHEDWVYPSDDGPLRIAAAACYERSGEKNGYNFVRLDVDAGLAEVWLREYRDTGWIPRIVPNKKTDHDGCWSLANLNWLKALQAKRKGIQPPQADDSEPAGLDTGEFGGEIRALIAGLLQHPAMEPLRKALSPQGAAEAATVLVPSGSGFDPGASVLAFHKASLDGFKHWATHSSPLLPKALELAEQVFGLLLLLAVSEDWIARQGDSVGDSSMVNIVAIPKVREEASVELVLARLGKRGGKWFLDPQDPHRLNILAGTGVMLGAEDGFGAPAKEAVRKSLWQRLYPGSDPYKTENWQIKLKRDLVRQADVYQRTYFVAVPASPEGNTPYDAGLLAELRRELPIGTFEIGSDGDEVLMVPEPEMISDISAFHRLLDDYRSHKP